VSTEKKLSILIVDDDLSLCNEFKGYFEQYPQFNVMSLVCSGDEAIEVIEQHRPDIIILDLVIPVYDGLYVVDYITNDMSNYQPIIYVLSIMGSVKTAQMLNDCSMVKYYSIKPVRPQTVVNNLFRLIKDKQAVEAEGNQSGNHGNHGINSVTNVSHFMSKGLVNLEWLIEDYLRKLGLQSNLISTKCTRVAIDIGIRADKNNRLGMMEIYSQAGQVFTPSISTVAVDRNVRSVVARVIKNSTPVFQKYFEEEYHNGGAKLNNSLFLSKSVDILKRWIMENGDDTAFS